MMHKKISAAVTGLLTAASAMGLFPAGADAAEEYLIRDKWGYCTTANYAESEHFVIFYGNNDTTGHVNAEFLQRNLESYEKLWKCYGEYLGMENMNVDIYGRSSQKYKTNIYLTETGLDQYATGWAFMSAEDGYGIEIISPSAMLDELTIAHEFGHVVTMQQKAWVDQSITGAWWEPLANWFREMYLASDYYTGTPNTGFFEPYLRNLSLTMPHGRNYYEVWPFLMYLSTNPDNFDGLGTLAVKRIISEAAPDEHPFDTITRLFGTDAQVIFANYAKRMATMDLGNGTLYKERTEELMRNSPWFWNLYYTVPEDKGYGWLVSPEEDAPMQGGINIIPLSITGSSVSAELRGLSDDPNADWQACIVTVDANGKSSYSDIFGPGQSMTVSADGAVSAYLTVSAMPRTIVRSNAFNKEDQASYKNSAERRRYPYEVRFTGAEVRQSGGYSKGRGHAHSNGGGWVADTAKVDDSVYVSPDAMVLGNAVLTGNARVEDYAIINGDVSVSDNAVISGHAIINGGGYYYSDGWKLGKVTISGNAQVGDSAVVITGCTVSGNAKVLQKAYITEASTITDNAVVKGMTYLYGSGNVSGNTILDGDFANDTFKTDKLNFGWLDPDHGSYQISEGYVAGYDFDTERSVWAEDEYAVSDALIQGAQWESERTSANGVLSFDGENDHVILDSSAVRSHDLQISAGVLWKGGAADQQILWLGDENAHLSLTPCNSDGVAELVLTDGKTTEKLTAAQALPKGEFTQVTIRIINGKGTLLIGGQTAAQSDLTLDAVKVLSAAENDGCFIGKGSDGGYFKGGVDYINTYFKEVPEPQVTYFGSEEPDDTDPAGKVAGDVNADGRFDMDDLVMMQRFLLGKGGLTDPDAGELSTDGKLNVYDLIAMKQLYLK